MNVFLFRFLWLFIFFFVAGITVKAQQTDHDSIIKKKSFLEKMIPRYGKIQFAGSMGMLSAGTGWDYGRKHWETDVLFGIVPKEGNRKTMFTFTLKQNYIPWKIHLKDQFYLDILACGFYINMAFNDKLWVTSPGYYPNRYYTFSTKIRTHVFLGERIHFNLDKQLWKIQSVSLFYELSASDIYIETTLNNRTIKPKDYLSLSFGIKLQIL